MALILQCLSYCIAYYIHQNAGSVGSARFASASYSKQYNSLRLLFQKSWYNAGVPQNISCTSKSPSTWAQLVQEFESVCTDIIVLRDRGQNNIYYAFCRSNSQASLLLWGERWNLVLKSTAKYICNQNQKSYMQAILHFGGLIYFKVFFWELTKKTPNKPNQKKPTTKLNQTTEQYKRRKTTTIA